MSATSLTQENTSSSLLAGNDGFATSFQYISSITVGSLGASSVTFSEIPQNFRHLQIRGISKSDRTAGTGAFTFRLNSDTGTNYSGHILYGNGTSAGAQNNPATTGYSYSGFLTGLTSGLTENMYTASITDILDYTNTTKNKTIRNLFGHDCNGVTSQGEVGLASGLWISTAPVTSIMVYSTGYNLLRYTSFALYGVK